MAAILNYSGKMPRYPILSTVAEGARQACSCRHAVQVVGGPPPKRRLKSPARSNISTKFGRMGFSRLEQGLGPALLFAAGLFGVRIRSRVRIAPGAPLRYKAGHAAGTEWCPFARCRFSFHADGPHAAPRSIGVTRTRKAAGRQPTEFPLQCSGYPQYGGMTRWRQSHYPLKTIKAAFADATRLNRTMTAADGAEELGLDEQAVVDVVAALRAVISISRCRPTSTLRFGKMSTGRLSRAESCM
jgi:hypothetical protein